MRALTVRQPWAGSIIHHGKDVENRSTNVAGSYRGPVAIHVSLRHDYAAVAAHDAVHGHIDQQNTYGYGHIIGVVDLWAVHRAQPFCCPNRGAKPFGSPWAMADHWHLSLANPRPLPDPIPYRGRLGLWYLPDPIIDRIHDQLT